jgi:hypothetical protein
MLSRCLLRLVALHCAISLNEWSTSQLALHAYGSVESAFTPHLARLQMPTTVELNLDHHLLDQHQAAAVELTGPPHALLDPLPAVQPVFLRLNPLVVNLTVPFRLIRLASIKLTHSDCLVAHAARTFIIHLRFTYSP